MRTQSPVRAPHPVFVGRSAELAELVAAVRRPPSVVLVEGEAGVGKTRLVRELLSHNAIRGRAVLPGACQPMRAPFPYGPVVDILRGTEDLLARVAGALSPIVGALSPLLPELVPLLPPAPPRGDLATERHQVFRAVRELLGAYGPAVLVVEDVHWADEGTQELLRFLTERPSAALSVILTYRRETDGGAAGLPGAALRLLSDQRNTLLRLRPLEPPDVAALAADLLGTAGVDADFAVELHRRTAGIPFVIEEVLREVRDAGVDDPGLRVLDQVDIPVLLRDTMADRLARLGPTVTAVARAAAVLDRPATAAELAAVTGMPARRVESVLTRALAAAVLHEAGQDRYALRHPLASQAVHVSIPGPLRRRLHASAAELDAEPVRLAHHHRQAGDHANWVRWTIAAVDHACAVGDTALALQVLETALADDELPARARNTLAVRLSRAAINGIVHDGTIKRLRGLLRDDVLDARSRGEVRLNLGILLVNQAGEAEAGQTEIEMAVHDLAHRPALAARGLAALVLPSFGGRPLRDHLEWARRAAEATVHDEEVAVAVRANQVTLLAQIADPGAWAAADALPPPTRSPKVRRQLTRAYDNLADAAAWTGHYALARTFLDTGSLLMADTDVPFLSMLATGTSLRLDAATGRWSTLERDAEQLVEQAGDMVHLAGDAWLALGWLANARGDRTRAAEHFDSAQSAAPQTAPVQTAVAAGRVAIAMARGDAPAAAVGADRALAKVRAKGVWPWAADLVPQAVRALLRAGRPQDARRLVDEFADGVSDSDAPLAAAAVVLCRALVAPTPAEALDHHTRAAESYAALPHPHTAALTRELAARAAIDLGDTATAATLTAAAAATFTQLGLPKDAARCARLSRRLPRSAPLGRRGYGATLSPREREVVNLVTDGMTNRQIAEALFLSQRTVENHVARIMRKLGVASRAEFDRID